jgi:lactoylglutathione lyase
MSITDIGHPAYGCHDLQATLDFYALLGITESFRLLKDDGSVRLVYLHVAGDRFIELFPGGPPVSDQSTRDRQSYRHLCLVTDDIEGMVEHLRANGVTIDTEPKVGLDFNTQAWMRDPEDNQIELMQLSPESPQRAIADRTAFPASEILVQAD